MSDDAHLEALTRQCANATPLGRLAGSEAAQVIRWLIDNGHLTRTGKPLEQPRQAPRIVARKHDGTPIYDVGADHSTHQTVTMGRAS